LGVFSADGEWWWDGAHWVATAEILLTIPETEFERSGRLKQARRLVIVREWMQGIGYVGVGSIFGIPLVPFFVIAYMVVLRRVFRAYRTWTLELLSSATAQLMGPEEPMLAGETTVWPPLTWWPQVQRDFAVAATRTHVLMYWFTDYDSPVCRVIWVARPQDVDMRVLNGFLWHKRLAIGYGGRWWTLRGTWGAFEPEQVLQTWANSRQEEVVPVVTSKP
jgi:hypothetical protein